MSSYNGNGHRRVNWLASFPFMEKNPYGRLLYGSLEREGIRTVQDPQLHLRWLWRERRRVDFLHFHWDKFYYESLSLRPRFRQVRSWGKLARYACLLAIARGLGYRIVWTVHEVVPHESRSRRRDLLAAAVLARASHALLAHDQATAHRARSWLKVAPKRLSIVPHGSYQDFYPAGRPREQVRADWGIDASAFAFLAFGNLRSYKRLDLLLEAFAALERKDVALIVAGEFLWRFREPEWEQWTLAKLARAAQRDPRIRYRISRVPDHEVSELHRACDAAVMARSDGWTSGSMVLAMSEGLPVVAARRPAYVSLLGDGAAGWLYEPGDAGSLTEALNSAAGDREMAASRGREARRRATHLNWDEIASSTASVMRSTLG